MKKIITILTLLIPFFAIAITFNSCKKAPPDAPIIITEIAGKVLAKKSGNALAGAQITTVPVTSSVITGSDGSYILTDIVAGSYKITAQKAGYNTNSTNVTVAEGQTVSADILLDLQSPELSVNPVTLDFSTGQTNLTFNITNLTNVGEVTWSIGLNQPWLSVIPSSGTTTTETDIVTVTVNRDSLDFGNYSALITINSDFGTKQINVTMIKSNPNAPQLSVTPVSIDFGTVSSSKTLLLKNTGTGTLNWTATTNDSWIIISANSGSTTGGNTSSLTVSINKSGLSANSYTGTILINSNGGSQVVNVAMTVQQGTLDPPTLQITGNPTKTSISLGWTKVNSTNFDNYKLYRSVVSNVDESGTLVTTIANSDQNTFTDNGLNSGTTYYYRVYAYSQNGIGSASNEIIASTSRQIGTWVSTITLPNFYDYGDYEKVLMQIVSEHDVWITSKNDIWHYNGSDWSIDSTVNLGTSYNIEEISFENSNNGWMLTSSSSDAYIYNYNGITWTKGTRLIFNSATDMIKFSDNNIWVIGKGKIYHFNGSEWSTTTIDMGYDHGGVDLGAISENNIWALSSNKVFHYDGVGWSNVTNMGISLHAINILGANDIWVADNSFDSYGLYHYDGSGFESIERNSPRFALEMLSANEGWSSKGDKLSYFDGNGWQDVDYPVVSTVICIKFLTRSKGWAVTSNGTILRYVE